MFEQLLQGVDLLNGIAAQRHRSRSRHTKAARWTSSASSDCAALFRSRSKYCVIGSRLSLSDTRLDFGTSAIRANAGRDVRLKEAVQRNALLLGAQGCGGVHILWQAEPQLPAE